MTSRLMLPCYSPCCKAIHLTCIKHLFSYAQKSFINTLNFIKISTCMCFYKQGISLLIDALDISIQIRAWAFPIFFQIYVKNALEMIINQDYRGAEFEK